MAKKQEKEIERWVTVNGARVPIFKDGSIGGPKALRDKVKAKNAKVEKLVNENFKTAKEWDKEEKKSTASKKDSGSKERLSVYERQLAEVNDELANAPKSKALRNEEGIRELEKKKAQLEGYIAKEKGTTAKKVPAYITGGKNLKSLESKLKEHGFGLESADAADIDRDARNMNGEKVSLYDKDGNEYRGTFNRYSNGDYEIIGIRKEWYNRKPTDTHPTGVEDDTKEKQIARNKAEADERNNQVSDRVKSYQDKFLKKRSVEEIKEIQSNIEKGSKLTGYTESDMVAMRAIENELKQRSGKKSKEDIARDKETFRKAKEHEARVKTKAQASKQAVKDIKQGLKEYGPKRGMWQDVKKADAEWKRISKLFSTGQISNEAYEEIYYLFGENFHKGYKIRNRKG